MDCQGHGQPENHHSPLAQAASCPKGTPTLIRYTLQGKPAIPYSCTRPLSYLILSNKRIICKLTITPMHKMAAPCGQRWLPLCGHR